MINYHKNSDLFEVNGRISCVAIECDLACCKKKSVRISFGGQMQNGRRSRRSLGKSLMTFYENCESQIKNLKFKMRFTFVLSLLTLVTCQSEDFDLFTECL